MAYISTVEVAEIRKQLKDRFPKFRFAVRKSSGSTEVSVAVLKGPRDFSDIMEGHKYAQINQYWIDDFYPAHAEFLNQVMEVIKSAPSSAPGGRAWYDESDAMVDYFNTAYYIYLGVGEYDKPYQYTKDQQLLPERLGGSVPSSRPLHSIVILNTSGNNHDTSK